MNVELDVEKKLQALVAKDRIRVKEFFIDFDKLRKGQVGEAAVSILKCDFMGFYCDIDFSRFFNYFLSVTNLMNFYIYSSEHALAL